MAWYGTPLPFDIRNFAFGTKLQSKSLKEQRSWPLETVNTHHLWHVSRRGCAPLRRHTFSGAVISCCLDPLLLAATVAAAAGVESCDALAVNRRKRGCEWACEWSRECTWAQLSERAREQECGLVCANRRASRRTREPELKLGRGSAKALAPLGLGMAHFNLPTAREGFRGAAGKVTFQGCPRLLHCDDVNI
eukprot:361172-Chlamydomonas_euryale.AAC.5